MNWRKEFFLALMLTICLIPVSKAQDMVTLGTGLSISHPQTNLSDRPSTVLQPGIGLFISGDIYFKIHPWLYLQICPGLMQKNYTLKRIGTMEGQYESYRNTYLQAPLLVHVVCGERIQAFADAGAFGAFWLNGSERGKIADIFSASTTQSGETFSLRDFNIKHAFQSGIDNRIELGWVVGAGIQHNLNTGKIISLNVRYFRSLTAQQKSYMIHQVPTYNQSMTISVNTIFSIRNLKKKGK
jgi:hypothetical protein